MMVLRTECWYLRAILRLIFMSIFIILFLNSCSEREGRISVKQLGFEIYVYQALNVGFEFEYRVEDYQMIKKKNGKFQERFMLSVEKEEYQKIFNAAKKVKDCGLTWASPKLDGQRKNEVEKIDAIICRVSLWGEGLLLGSYFKENINQISIHIDELNQTGVF